MLVVFPEFATALAGAEKAHVPGGCEVVPERAVHKAQVSLEEEAIAARVVGQSEDLGPQGIANALVGIQVQLPRVLRGMLSMAQLRWSP